MIGLTLNDRYELQSEIGRGGMGIVYLAKDKLLDRQVAVKVVSGGDLGSEGRQRLLQEARVVASLNHPHIVTVYDVGRTKVPTLPYEMTYIVMEYVAGQSLAAFHPSTLEDILQIGEQICLALQNAHARGVIHRDLKPENVILGDGQAVKLMDFGLARILGRSRLTEEGTLMGTLAYLAPEVILGEPASTQSDLYALGVMLYQLAAGRLPFSGETPTAVLAQHLHAPVVPPSTFNEAIPYAFDQLITQLMAKQPQSRPASAGQVRSSLAQIGAPAPQHEPAAVSPPLARLARGRLVGRERELDQAINRWQEAVAGRGQVLLISGEPGIGKTRFVRELATFVEIHGGLVLQGECYEAEPLPFSPVAQMVRRSFERDPRPELPEAAFSSLLAIAPDLLLQVPLPPPHEELEPQAERQRLLDSLTAWCATLMAGSTGLMLFFDDIHWADGGTLALLGQLARRLRHKPLLIVATYREVELDDAHPLHQVLTTLNRERLAERIKLTRLTRACTQEMLQYIFSEAITPGFLDAIYRETEGNPFFIEEVCKVLVDKGLLRHEQGHWHRLATDEIEIPQSIRLAIQSRLARLEKHELSLLQIAALLGREFEFELLVAVAGRNVDGTFDEEICIDVIEQAQNAQLISELPRAGLQEALVFSFTHALIRTTILANLSTLRRQRLQRQVALALEETCPERREELAALLGRYFAEAGDGQRAITYLLLSGDRARKMHAYREAAVAYEQALIFLREASDQQFTARTLMKLGLIYHNDFDFANAHQAYEEGFTLWQQAAAQPAQDALDLPPAPHALRVLMPRPYTFDPTEVVDANTLPFLNQLFSALVQLGPEGDVLPDGAHSWELLDGGRRYIFHLREDVFWSDGQRVTAADFVFSWQRTLEPVGGWRSGSFLYDLEGAVAFNQGQLADPQQIGVRALDDWTLEIRLQGPTSYFLQLLTTAWPVPSHRVAALGNAWAEPQNIVSNGPFLLQESGDNQQLILNKNPNYHGRFTGNVERITYHLLDGEQLLNWYAADRLDIGFFTLMNPLQAERARNRFSSDYVSLPTPSTMLLAFDTTRPPFDDPAVRRALVLATDKAYFVNVLSRGLSTVAHGGVVPPGIAGHVKDISLPFDVEEARRLLAQAGFGQGHGFPVVTFTSIFPLDDANEPLNWLREQWQQNLSITVQMQYVPFGQITRHLAQETPHFWILGWMADYPDPDNFLRIADWTGFTGWNNKKYKQLVQDARWEADEETRMAMYRQAEIILAQEAAVAPIDYGRAHLLVKPWVKGFRLSPLLGVAYEDIVIEDHDREKGVSGVDHSR